MRGGEPSARRESPSGPPATPRPGGLRRRLVAALVLAALAPVAAVSVASVALIFSGLEENIEADASRGMEAARGLLLRQVQEVAAGARRLGDDTMLLRAMAE